MANVTASAHINAPIDRVFEMFTDLEHRILACLRHSRHQVLTTRGFDLGTRWIETREVLGRLDEAEMEVTAFEKNHGYTITHHKGGVRIDTEFAFEPTANGTRVGVSFAMNPQGLPPGLLSPLEWAISGKVRDVLNRIWRISSRRVERLVAA